jgi:multidrug resistance efflux pump
LGVAEQGLGSREAQAADLEASVERRQRALDARQIELERFEQSLNAREQALDSAEGDLEQRRRLRIGEASPQATSA